MDLGKKNKNTQLLYDAATAILGIYPREMKTYVYTKTCTRMLIALFAIIKNCNQFRRPLIGKSLNKLWGFPGGAVVESLPANAGDAGSSPGLGRSHMPQSN